MDQRPSRSRGWTKGLPGAEDGPKAFPEQRMDQRPSRSRGWTKGLPGAEDGPKAFPEQRMDQRPAAQRPKTPIWTQIPLRSNQVCFHSGDNGRTDVQQMGGHGTETQYDD
ncbi:unnamed protein product [Lota lota]